MDEDIIMAMIGNLTTEVTNVKSAVDSMASDVSPVYHMDTQLDRIIELLEEIANKK